MRYNLAVSAVALFSAACTVEVADLTQPLFYDPPVNRQTFKVGVRSTTDITVTNVELYSPGLASSPMSPVGNNEFEARLDVGHCIGAVAFKVDVTYQLPFDRNLKTKTFPDAGAFTRPVVGLPSECENFADEYAQTFFVDHSDDFPDAEPGDGRCAGSMAPDGSVSCSLRAAVMEANAKPGNDLIIVGYGRHVLTLSGDEGAAGVDDSIGDLDITDSVTIQGATPITNLDQILRRTRNPQTDLTGSGSNDFFSQIDGDGRHRIFHVPSPDVVLRLRHLSLSGGHGAIAGGAIRNAGTLTLERVVIAQNTVAAPMRSDRASTGGGVRNDGKLFGDEVAFAHNTATGPNPSGGGLYNTGQATLRRALFAYNDARFGSAISNHGSLVLENATLHANRWSGGSGSGDPAGVLSNTGDTRLSFVTFGGHVLNDRGRLLAGSGGTIRVRNVLWIGNTTNPGAFLCWGGAFVSEGGNVIDRGSCRFSNARHRLDHQNVGSIAGAGDLVDLGGFLPVIPIGAPLAGSTAFDARDKGSFPPYPVSDQRGHGFDRRVDGDGNGTALPDPGAFEYTPR